MRYAEAELADPAFGVSLGRDRASFVIATLEPMLSPERVARVREVVAARLSSVVVVLDGIEDPFNAAAVLRSCDAFGVQEVHVIEHAGRFRPARGVTMGAHKWLDLERHRGEVAARACVEGLRRRGFRTLAASMHGEVGERELSKMARVAIVMGNERVGACAAVRDAVDGTFRVEMRGFVESFNVSVATALALHGVTEGRPGDLGADARHSLYARLLTSAVRGADAILERAQRDTASRRTEDDAARVAPSERATSPAVANSRGES